MFLNLKNWTYKFTDFKKNVTEDILIYKYTRFNTKTIKFQYKYK